MIELAALCMGLNIYFEARGEDVRGQYAVAQVTMNRAGRDPRKVCPIVLAPNQFSWVKERMERVGRGWRLKQGEHPKEDAAWQRAYQIAKVTLSGHMPDFTNGATHYHTTAVKPNWRKRLMFVAQIGNHLFYREMA